jgi:hypothetical protein
MHTGTGRIVELIFDHGQRLARIACPPALIPSVGQYLLAGDGSNDPLPVPLFYTDSAPDSFICAPPVRDSWSVGQGLFLRGPLGRGFTIPAAAQKIALIAYDDAPWRLRGLIRSLLTRNAAVVVLCDELFDSLPDEVEIQPVSAMDEIVKWADYAAFDVARENLFQLHERLGVLRQAAVKCEAEILIRAPMPCGGIAECGVCAINVKSGWRMVCREGPVCRAGDF